MQLFPITLPKQNICNETALYYRTSDPVQYDETTGIITMGKNTVLSLDTYFNCFSYSKYLQYTHANILEVHMQVQGDVQLRMMKAELQNSRIYRTEKLTQTVHSECMEEVVLQYDFGKEQGSGILYVEVKALSNNAAVQFGYYGSPIAHEQLNHTRLAAVICTYKREAYVKRNLYHLADTILADAELQKHIEILVIDNGKTLQKEEIEQTNIKLYPNKNCGGSGGFTRGIIEALNRKEEFSHVLLMDDDILLESNVLVKTIRFLQIVRPEHADLALGGSMLRLDDMTVQHEAGGRWTGRKIININKGFNLCNTMDLLKNEIDMHPDYNAWWYCCMPLSKIDESNLPLPLFVREDDVEYGIRLFDNWLIMNGVGVWHEPFDKKDNLVMEYYNTRNQLILNAIHYPNNPFYKNLYSLVRTTGKLLLKGNAKFVEIPFKGFDDFLLGVDFILNNDSEKIHQELVQWGNSLKHKEEKTLAAYYWYAGTRFIVTCVNGMRKYSAIVNAYQLQKGELMMLDTWKEKLEIEV